MNSHGGHLVNFADKLGWTSLHHAAYNESNKIVIRRIVQEQERFGHQFVYPDKVSTPFQIAAEKGFTSTVNFLMQSWPSSSSAYTTSDKNGKNILHLAALQSKNKMIQGILEHCPEEHKKEFVNKQDNKDNTPLHELMRLGCFVLEFLRYQGLDTKVKNNDDWTPLDMLYVKEEIIGDQVFKVFSFYYINLVISFSGLIYKHSSKMWCQRKSNYIIHFF